MAAPQIYLGSTPTDLLGTRHQVADLLQSLGYEVIDATTIVSRAGENAHADLATILRTHVPGLTGMVHLVGTSYTHPAVPGAAITPPSSGDLSLAQFEQCLAQESSIPCYTYLLGEDFPYDAAPIDPPQLQILQHRHRKRILAQPSGWESVDSLEQLLRRLRHITYRLEELRATLPLSPSPIAATVTAPSSVSSNHPTPASSVTTPLPGPIPVKTPSSWDSAPMDGTPSTPPSLSTPEREGFGARIGRYFSYVVYLLLLSIVTTTAKQCFGPEKKTYSYPTGYPYSEKLIPSQPPFDPAPLPWPSDIPLHDPTLDPKPPAPLPSSSQPPLFPGATPPQSSSSPASSPITPLPPPGQEALASIPLAPPRDTAAGIYSAERLSILLACSGAEARAASPGSLWVHYGRRTHHALAVEFGKTPEEISALVYDDDFWDDIIVSNHQRPLREAFHTRLVGPSEKTVAHADQAIALAQAAHPRDFLSERLAWLIKGDAQLSTSDFTSAVTSYRHALALTHKDSHTLTWCDISDRIAHAHRCAGLWSEARTVLRESIRLREEISGKDAATLSAPITDLAWTTHALTGSPEAVTLLRRALAIDTTQLGPRNPRTVERMLELASILDPVSQHKEIITLLRSALEIEEACWGSSDRMVTEVLCRLSTALVASRQGAPSYTEAEELARRAIHILGKKDKDAFLYIPLTNTTLHVRMLITLAWALHAQDRTSEAAEVTRQAWDILIKYKSVQDGDIHLAWHWDRVLHLASLLPTGTPPTELVARAADIAQAMEKFLGPHHTSLAASLESIATTIAASDPSRPIEYLRRATQIASQQHGPHHPQTLRYLTRLLELMRQQRRPVEEMRPFIDMALAGAQRLTTPDDPPTIRALISLRDSLRQSGHDSEAKSLTTRIAAFHAAHPGVIASTSSTPSASTGKQLRSTFTDDYITEQMLEIVVTAAQRPYPSDHLITPKQAIQDAITITADTLSADRRAYSAAIMEKAGLSQKESFPYSFASMTRHFFLEDYSRAQQIGRDIRTHKDSRPDLRALGALIEACASRMLRNDTAAIESAREGRKQTKPGSMFWANLTFLIARSHLDMGDIASAIHEYESLVKNTENTKDGNILRATAMRDLAEALILSAPTAHDSIATTYARAEKYLRTALRNHEKHAPTSRYPAILDQCRLAWLISLIGGPSCSDADEMNASAITTLGTLLTPQHPDLIQLHITQGDALTGALRFDEAQISLKRAHTLCEFHGGKSSPTMRSILARLGMLEIIEKDYQAAITLLTAARSMPVDSSGDAQALHISIHAALGMAHGALGDATTAQGHFRRSLDLARTLQTADACSHLAVVMSLIHSQEKAPQAALEFIDKAIELVEAQAPAHEYALIQLLDGRSTCHYYQKDEPSKRAALEAAAAIEEKLDAISLRPSADIRRNISYDLMYVGRDIEAESILRRAIAAIGAAYRRTGVEHFEHFFLPTSYRMHLRESIPSMSDEELEARIQAILDGKPVPDISHLFNR